MASLYIVVQRKNMAHTTYSIHLPDPQLLERVRAAAKMQDISPGAFIRSAVEKAVTDFEKKRNKKRAA